MTASYIQIASHLREQIKKGLLPVGSRLSERKLAEEYNIGRSTIAAALRVLKDEGYINSTAKSGTVVLNTVSGGNTMWDSLVRRGLNATGHYPYSMASMHYIFRKKCATFGLHEEFEPYAPLQKAFARLSKKKDIVKDLNTYDEKGLPLLRETLVGHLKRYGIKTSADNIVIFQGYLEAVYTIAVSLLNQGTNLYAMSGDMILKMATVRSTGVNMHSIPYDGEGMIVDKFTQSIKRGLDLLYINSVNCFPSGLTHSDNRMNELLAACRKYNVPILENDFLRDLWVTPPPAPMRARDSEQVIYIGTMANSYVTGVRLGWAVVPDSVLPRICDVKLQMNSSNSSGSELIVNEILSKGHYYEFLDKLHEKLPDRVAKANQIIEKHLGKYVKWEPSNAVYTILLEFDEKVDVNKLIIENPYFIMPTGSPDGKFHSAFLYALGMSLVELEELCKICADSVKKQIG